jgi:molybdopterin/thiamine biosynthesis adenylyltransferase
MTAVLRIPQPIYERATAHLLTGSGEHFAFFHARVDRAGAELVFTAREATLVPDEHVRLGEHGYDIDEDYLLTVINAAVRDGRALVEAHNHGGSMPRFSSIDLDQMAEFVPYVIDSLNGRPYGATVWGDQTITGYCYERAEQPQELRSVCVIGKSLRQLVSRDDDLSGPRERFDRQLPWFTPAGQRQLARLRVVVAGVGGTGSPLALELGYLGVRDFVLIDPDRSDESSMNRLMSADAADIDTPKAILTRRRVLQVAPDARVKAVENDLRSSAALDLLKAADVIFGCVDNDGARLVLNELAVAHGIPYFDVGVGIDAREGKVSEAGGRLAVVLPGGPCLMCMELIDPEEAAYILSSPEQQRIAQERGYVTGLDTPAPAVVSLNTTLASLAVSELAVYLSGLRVVNPLTVLDLLGVGRTAGQWVVPERVDRTEGCVHCAQAHAGDRADVARYGRPR